MIMAKTTSVKQEDSQSRGYAIVESSGQQFWLQEKRYYDLDRLKAEVDQIVTLENVLLINDGKKISLGHPFVKGAQVQLKVMEHRRGPKIIVYKMRPKKKTRRKNGHRQELTRVMVESISIGTGKATKSATVKKSEVTPTKDSKTSKTVSVSKADKDSQTPSTSKEVKSTKTSKVSKTKKPTN